MVHGEMRLIDKKFRSQLTIHSIEYKHNILRYSIHMNTYSIGLLNLLQAYLISFSNTSISIRHGF